MPVRKKTFSCGHSGKGRFCHRCASEEQRKHAMLQAKTQRIQRLSQAPIPLDDLPPEIAEKTLEMIAALQQGASYMDFMGKRMKNMGQRHVISIPIGRRYRLICKEDNGQLEFIEAISHEEYNNRLSGNGWV
ncbi:DUF7682 family zinc-binding protein [Methylomagnum ishizawai]|uniref:DUF7682 family zinc-binding protein n=1 Tax=Methylomagnum ishizawai TaxID=1760988 RepID=UPI001C80AF59|nr:hypothetical protein [Methylomagnum ishizawai]